MLLVHNFDSDTFRDLTFYKMVFICFNMILIPMILEPEKLRITSFVGFGVVGVIIVTFWAYTIGLGFSNPGEIPAVDLSKADSIIGAQLYGVESIGVLLCIRATMKEKSKASKMVSISITLNALIFAINGLFASLTFVSPKSLVFFYFPDDSFMKFMTVLYYLTTPSIILVNLISNLQILEEIPVIQKYIIQDTRTGETSIQHLLLFRICLGFLIMSICLFGKRLYFLKKDLNEFVIVTVAGMFVVPYLGFIYPVPIMFRFCATILTSELGKKNKRREK